MATTILTLPELAAELKAMGKRLGDVRKHLPLKACAVVIRSAIQEGFTKGQSPSGQPWKPLAFARVRGGTKPLLDTNKLRASIQVKPEGEDTIRAWTNKIQANLMQHGRTIRPKKGKYLAIPLTRAAQRTGSPRLFGKKLGVKIGAKGGVMFSTTGKGKRKKETAEYALVKKVTIPARPFLGFSDEALQKVANLLFSAVWKHLFQGRN